MAERAFPFTTTGSGNATAYTEAQTTQWLKSVFLQDQSWGVLRDWLNELNPAVSGGNVTVDTGSAYVNGYWYLNDALKTITVPTPSVGTTGHRIILRLTHSSDTIQAVLKSSSDGVSSPPSLQQDSSIWEESVATLTKTVGGVVTLTDTRQFAQYATNHVKRTGDTMTDALLISNTLPYLGLIESAAAADNKRWHILASNETFIISASNDAVSVVGDVVRVNRTGTTIDSIDFPVLLGQLLRSGNVVLDAGAMRRQGGSSSDWSVTGTTNYDITSAIRIQFGSYNLAGTTGIVYFPVAFSAPPIVICGGIANSALTSVGYWGPGVVTATYFQYRTASNGTGFWIAIGTA